MLSRSSVDTKAQVEYFADILGQLLSASSNVEVKVLIGGAALIITPNLWQVAGTDGAAYDAVTAVDLARRMFLLPYAHIGQYAGCWSASALSNIRRDA